MRDGPAEVDLGVRDLLPSNLEDLGVAESTTIDIATLVGNEHAVFMGDEMNEVESDKSLAIGPTPLKVGITVEAIIQGTSEVKVAGY